MSLDALFKLDPTSPASNSNYAGANIAENCAPSGINNALRSLGSFVAQQLCYQSAAISSSVSTNICTTSTGLFIPITGANAINSFGSVPGEQPSSAVVRFLQFSSSASLSNGATLRLIGGVSRKTQPGDIGGYIHVGSADVWHEFLYSPADGGILNGSISISTVNAIVSTIGTLNVTGSASVSSLNIAGLAVGRRVAFYATAGVNASITATAVQLTWTESVDVGAHFASNTWTPPSGLFRITVAARISSGVLSSDTSNLILMEDGVSIGVSKSENMSLGSSQMVVSRIVQASGANAYTARIARGPSAGPGSLATAETYFLGEAV